MSLTKEIQQAVCKQEIEKGNIVSENFNYMFAGEMDVISYKKSGYINEYETKISRGDYKADAAKKKWHSYINKQYQYLPNYFSYVCPTNMIKVEELIYDWMGLYYFCAETKKITEVKKPKIIHKEKKEPIGLLTKISTQNNWKHYFGSCALTIKNKASEALYYGDEQRTKKTITQLEKDIELLRKRAVTAENELYLIERRKPQD